MRILFCLLFATCLTATLQAAPPPIQYVVSFADADRHAIDVEAIVPTSGKDNVEVMMPVWTPGSYLVREYSRHVESIAASRVLNDEALEIRKTAKNRWSIATSGSDSTIRLRYRLYCREMTVRTNWVERDFGVLNGASTFITLADGKPRAHQIRYLLPSNWQQAVCALPSHDQLPHTFVAASFDDVVDSPVVLGNPQVTHFEVDGIDHRLVTLNGEGLWDNDAAAKDVQRIVETQRDFWGSLPYQRYVFLNVLSETRGGLEHDNSTLLMASRWTFRNAERYRAWLGLVSHELFHAWNVRRLRPRALAAYDYERENHFDELWIAEGITSYYDDLLQVRAGLLSEKDYLEGVSRALKSVSTAPGSRVQPLRDSSYDAWIKYYRPDENAVNTRISYYTKGSLVAWLLDAKIRKASRGKKSLDDVMRQLYAKHSMQRGGYDSADFRRIVDAVAGQPLSEFLETAVDQAGDLDFSDAMELWGLEIGEPESADADNSEENNKNDEKNDKQDSQPAVELAAAATAKDLKPPYVGATISEEHGKMVVTAVVRGTPADRAGWNVDDELVALDGYRVTPTLWKDNLAQFEVGKPIDCLLSRRGRLVQRTITLEPNRPDAWKVRSLKEPTDAQQRNRRQWLAQPTPSAAAKT
ncbi:M61 family metallopeptidase [Roseimaritima ulvae]|uniref:M61 glycyl aminopeptidase n=1 Tax=Roseimaritima ulvae TaxID=980254 RepID=A0A5B9QRG3_9BACT|nr:M61 family metallopeptidase [Roseimaritima ulvae]QEG39646.1 M61 glycyl aminopeptidase [Roseimaritima ulvae]